MKPVIFLLCLFIVGFAFNGNATNHENLSGVVVLDIIEQNPSCGNSDGSITIIAEGEQGANLMYSIDGGMTFHPSNYFPDLPAGDYLVIVIDENFCSSIPESPQLVNTGVAEIDTLIYECLPGQGNLVNIYSEIISDFAVEYSWEAANGFESDAEDLMGVDPGVYQLIIRTAVGCADTMSIDVPQCCVFDVSCNLIDSIIVNTVDEIGDLPSSFLDSESSTDEADFISLGGFVGDSLCFPLVIEAVEDISGACDGEPFMGVRHFSITDGVETVECTQHILVLDSISIYNGYAPNAAFTVDTINCNQALVDLIILDQSENSIVIFDSDPAIDETGVDIAFSDSGLYNYTLIDTIYNCQIEGVIEVFEDLDQPDINILGSNLGCSITQVTLIAESSVDGLNYEWRANNGTIGNGNSLDVSNAGEYELVVTADNGCSNTASFTVEDESTALNLVLDFTPMLNCDQSVGQAFFLNISEEITVRWEDDQGGILSEDQEFTYTEEGEYFYYITSDDGCNQEGSFLVDSDLALPEADVAPILLDCDNPSETPTVTIVNNVDSFVWLDEQQNEIGTDPSINTDGFYYLAMVGENGCVDTLEIEVIADLDLPSIVLLDRDTLTCLNTEVLLVPEVNEDVAYSWEDPLGNESADEQYLATVGGVYTLSVTTDNGCSSEASVLIEVDTISPIFELEDINLNCNDSVAIFDVALMDEGLNYQWFDQAGNELSQTTTFSTSTEGQYTLEIISPNGCSSTQSANVFVDQDLPQASVDPIFLDCENPSANPALTIINNVEEFVWLNEEKNDIGTQPTIDTEGIYYVALEGANGCVDTLLVQAEADIELPAIELAERDTINCLEAEVLLTPMVNESATYNWVDPSGNESDSEEYLATEGGTYTVWVTGENGCSAEASILIEVDTISPMFTLEDFSLNCQDTIAEYEINLAGEDVSYQWTDSGGVTLSEENTFSTTASGEFNLEVTSSNGCSHTELTTVTVDQELPEGILAVEPKTCMEGSGLLEIDGLDPNIELTWFLEGNVYSNEEEIISPDDGTYELVLLNTNNHCEQMYSAEMFTESFPEAVTFDLEQPSCLEESAILSDIISDGGVGPFNVLLNGQAISSDGLAIQNSGLYALSVIDANGCAFDTSLVVNEVSYLDAYLDTDYLELFTSDTATVHLFTNRNIDEIESIEWQSEVIDLSCDDCFDPLLSNIDEDGFIEVWVTDTLGCEELLEIYIRRLYDPKVMAPNVFSSKANFENQYFNLFTNDEIEKILYLRVYDRAGEKMFENFDMEPNVNYLGWDGTFNNGPAITGVYTWIAELLVIDGSVIVMTGDVTLLR